MIVIAMETQYFRFVTLLQPFHFFWGKEKTRRTLRTLFDTLSAMACPLTVKKWTVPNCRSGPKLKTSRATNWFSNSQRQLGAAESIEAERFSNPHTCRAITAPAAQRSPQRRTQTRTH